jgi:hypothetical protein
MRFLISTRFRIRQSENQFNHFMMVNFKVDRVKPDLI